MSVPIDLATHLLDQTSLTDLVGDAIYSKRQPAGDPDRYLLISQFGGDPVYSLTGEVGITHSVIQVSCWARDPSGALKAWEIGDAVRNLLSGYRGEWNGRFINDCSLTNEPSELDEAPEDGSDLWWHGVTQDYRVTHAQGVPTFT